MLALPAGHRGAGAGLVARGLVLGSGRSGGEAGEGPAAAFAGFRGEHGGGAAGAVLLAGVPGGEDALVADDEQGRGEQHQGGQSHQAAPAAGDVAGGGVLGGGEAALGSGAAGVGPAPGFGGVVVFLPGFRVHVCRDGEGLPGAAGLGVLRGRRISGRSRFSCIEAGRSGHWILPMAAGQATRW
jgi:hypothetical protein